MCDSSFEDEISITNWSSDDTNWPQGGVSISIGPIETHDPPLQKDLFRHYITSQWIHSSHLADENPQWQIESWINSNPHIKELYQEGTLEIVHDENTEYYHCASEQEHFAWRIRWSEQLENQKTLFGR